jgi:hypothetical protein
MPIHMIMYVFVARRAIEKRRGEISRYSQHGERIILMSKWSWHEKNGVRKGPIRRRSDWLTPEEEEAQEHARHVREYSYSQVLVNGRGRLYEDYRTCGWCGKRRHQIEMIWTGDKWLCPSCHSAGVHI